MAKAKIQLNDEELTQYFENPLHFEEASLLPYFCNITDVDFGDWIDKENNIIELIITTESDQNKLNQEVTAYYMREEQYTLLN